MPSSPTPLLPVLLLALCGPAPLLAHGQGLDQETATTHNLGAHQHGLAHLRIAVDNDRLTVEWQMTQADLAGFEGDAAGQEARETLHRGVESMRQALMAGRPIGSGSCVVGSPEMRRIGGADAGGAGHDHDHGEAHSHDHAAEDDHHHHDEHHGQNDHGHADHLAIAEWICRGMAATEAFEIDPWSAFPSLQRVRVEWLGLSAQGITELAPGQRRIELR